MVRFPLPFHFCTSYIFFLLTPLSPPLPRSNYAGSDAAFMDVFFGTFVGSMEAKDKDGVKPREDAKSTLRTVPTLEFVAYLALACACVGAWALAALEVAAGTRSVPANEALALSAIAGFGPVLLASILSAAFGGVRPNPPKSMAAWASAMHLIVGSALCSLPVSWACWLALQ